MKNRSMVMPVLLTLLVLALGAGVFGVVVAYNEPLARPLDLGPAPAAAEPADQPAGGTAPTATPFAAVKPACGQTGKQLVLLTGADYEGGVWPNGADAIRLVQVDFDAQTVKVMAFPRDLQVVTSGLADHGMPEQRLGLAYHYELHGEETRKENIATAVNLLAVTLNENFGVRPDHYIVLELSEVPEMVDALGGVEINLREALVTDGGMAFEAGKQVINGEQAGEFVHCLNPGGEHGRMLRQDEFVKALRAKLDSDEVYPRVPALLQQFDEAIVTDLSAKELVDMACLMKTIGMENVQFFEIEGEELVSVGTNGALLPNVAAVKAFIADTLLSE